MKCLSLIFISIIIMSCGFFLLQDQDNNLDTFGYQLGYSFDQNGNAQHPDGYPANHPNNPNHGNSWQRW